MVKWPQRKSDHSPPWIELYYRVSVRLHDILGQKFSFFTVHNKHRDVIVPSYDFSLTIAPFPITKDSTTTGGTIRFLHRPFILTRSLWYESRSHIQIPAFCSKRLPRLLASVAANTCNKSAHQTSAVVNRTEFSKNSLIPRNMTSYAGHSAATWRTVWPAGVPCHPSSRRNRRSKNWLSR